MMRKKKIHELIDELEEELYLNYKKLNLAIIDARRQAHVFNAIREKIDAKKGWPWERN